jgi:arylsulfatase A
MYYIFKIISKIAITQSKISYFIGMGFGILVISCKEETKNTIADKPNIIYILADDLGYGDLGIYGQEKFSTPNIDRLASQGMVFTQHYSGSTVCAPSRSALMTGMHTGHTVVRGNKEIQPEGQYPIPDNTYTIAEALKKAGYITGAFGKWGLGFPGSQGDPINQGFDVFYGYNCQRMGHNYYPYHLWSNKDSIILSENSNKRDGIYAPELIHAQTLKFLEDNQDNPFFLYVPSIIPHAELAAPEAYLEKHKGNYPPEEMYKGIDDGPKFNQGTYRSQKNPHAAFAAMINVLDDQVGDIMAKVEKLGLSKNTIIIFTSDNGPHREGGADPEYFDSNGPLKGLKRDLYEGGIRVPMIVRWPGKVSPNSKTDHISAFWDVFPTFSEIAGIAAPNELDGISFLPTLLQKDNQEQHDYLYWEFHEKGGRQAIRKGDWKAVKYGVLNNPEAPIELYNLKDDLGEENNIAPLHTEVVKEMQSIFDTARTESKVFTFSSDTDLTKDLE